MEAWQWAYRGQLTDEYLDGLSLEEKLSMWREVLGDPGERRVWVAERDGRVVGFCSTGPNGDQGGKPGTMEVFTLYLEQAVVGEGVGRALLERALDDLRERSCRRAALWVLESNELGRRFYEKAGWRHDGTITTQRIDCENLPTVRYTADLG